MSRVVRASSHWWLEPGDEVCASCHVLHHREILVHCEDCGEWVCPVCGVEVLEETRVVVCDACAEERG